MDDCIFCQIIRGEMLSSTVYEDDRCTVFMDISPINEGHLLVVPKEHVPNWHEMPEALAGYLMEVGIKMNKVLRQTTIKLEGVNFLAADGKAAGQEVFHAHLHVVPRFKGDGFGWKFSKEYPTHPGRTLLETVADEIREQLKAEE